MATYDRVYTDEPNLQMNFSLTERPVYGSSRVANNTEEVLLVSQIIGTPTTTNYFDNPEILSHTNGYKHFELTNHLGNVMAVVSDKRTPIITGSEITGYTPELLIAKDYYPFGMEMSGRYGGDWGTEPDDEYRFGFQGQEKNDDWTGQTGSHLDFKYRVYDARIGRFFAIDPLAAKYPHNSTYAFSENRVIDAIELEGLESFQINIMRITNNYGEPYYVASVTLISLTADFLVLDEQGKELNDFKYCYLQQQLQDVEVINPGKGLTLYFPHKTIGEDEFTQAEAGYFTFTDPFPKLLNYEMSEKGGLAYHFGTGEPPDITIDNVLEVGTVPENAVKMDVYLPTQELRDEYKKQWVTKGNNEKYNINANSINFLDKPAEGGQYKSDDYMQVIFYTPEPCDE